MCLWAAECISQQANLPGSMPCFFKQSLEGRTCSASVQRCPDSCLIVVVCVCWNLIGWVARFAVLFTQVVNDYMRLASKSLIPYWVHPYAEGDTANVLYFPHPHYLWNWTWLPRNEGEGISEEEAELGKRYFSSLPKAMRCCYLMLFDVICMFSCAVQSNCISTIFKDQRSKPDLQKVLWSIFASQMSLLKRPPNP